MNISVLQRAFVDKIVECKGTFWSSKILPLVGFGKVFFYGLTLTIYLWRLSMYRNVNLLLLLFYKE